MNPQTGNGDDRAPSDVAELLGERPAQQRSEWVIDRAGWTVMAVILAAALLGLWGNGPLSSAKATSLDGRLSIAYDRFVRNQGSTSIRVRVEPNTAVDGIVGVAVGSDYLMQNQMRALTPEPSSVTAHQGFYVYAFDVRPDAPLTVRFDLRPDPDTWVASHTTQLGVVGSPSVQIRQYVFP